MRQKINILVAGIGGASLGTEVGKALALDPLFRTVGADISPTAYGHFCDLFSTTYVIDSENYIASILDICEREEISAIVPGGEKPMALLARERSALSNRGVALAMNDSELVERMSNKAQCFAELASLGFEIPAVKSIRLEGDLHDLPYPMIVKPSLDSGGSTGVYFATSPKEAWAFSLILIEQGKRPIAQQYIPHDEGEFTVGVLSLPSGALHSSIALRRIFDNKISIAEKGRHHLISSGYSQGFIDDYPEIRLACSRIAEAVGSVGPLNVQGRFSSGTFFPFEINPRFSASTYLRALAGYNEIAIYLRATICGEIQPEPAIQYGLYLRSFEQLFVHKEELRF